jgi:hypothetical protein
MFIGDLDPVTLAFDSRTFVRMSRMSLAKGKKAWRLRMVYLRVRKNRSRWLVVVTVKGRSYIRHLCVFRLCQCNSS